MFSQDEINENGYNLKNRFEIKPFRSKTGKQNMYIYLEKEFSELSYLEQKEQISKYIAEVLERAISKLKKKKLDYDFDLMFNDFEAIINEWKANNCG